MGRARTKRHTKLRISSNSQNELPLPTCLRILISTVDPGGVDRIDLKADDVNTVESGREGPFSAEKHS